MLTTLVPYLNAAAGRAIGALADAAAAQPAALSVLLAALAGLAGALWLDLVARRPSPRAAERPVKMRNR